MTTPSTTRGSGCTGGAQATAGSPGWRWVPWAAFGSTQPTGFAEIRPGVAGGGGTGSSTPSLTGTRVVSASGSGDAEGRSSLASGPSLPDVCQLIRTLHNPPPHPIGSPPIAVAPAGSTRHPPDPDRRRTVQELLELR